MANDVNTLSARMDFLRNDNDWFSLHIGQLWENWQYSSEAMNMRSTRKEIEQILYATDANDGIGGDYHSHKTVIPKLTQISDTLKTQYVEAILPHDDVVEFQTDEDLEDADETRWTVESYIRSRHKMYGHKNVLVDLIADYVDVGECFVETLYSSQKAEVDGAFVREGYVGPKMRRIDPSRIAFDRRATNFNEAPKIVQAVRTLGDIARDIQNEELDESYREVLSKAMEFRHGVRTNEGVFDEEDYMHGWGSANEYYSGDEVEILTFYGSVFNTEAMTLHSNRKVVVIDRKFTLSNTAIDTMDGNAHLRAAFWRKKANKLQGMSPLANLVGMQFMINHWENTRADALDAMVNPDKVISGLSEITHNSDGSKDYHVYERGSVSNLAPDTTILTAENNIAALEHRMEQYAGVPPEAFGFKTPGEQTKFEVSERLSRGALVFQSKTSLFEELLLLPAINDELELAVKNVTNAFTLEVSTPEGDVFKTINADMLKRRGSLIPTGAQASRLKAQYAQEIQQFQAALQIDPTVAIHFPAKLLAKAWNNVLTGGRRKGLFEEYGRIYEEVEMQQLQQAAAEQTAVNESVSTVTPDGLAPEAPPISTDQ